LTKVQKWKLQCSSCDETFSSVRSFTKYCKKCAPNQLAWSRLATYGLSHVQFLNLLEKQKNACAICKQTFSTLKPHRNKTSSIVIDHDHSTNSVRGLLCSNCNTIVGHLEQHTDDWLGCALSYIGRKHV